MQLRTMTDKGRLLTDGTVKSCTSVEFASGIRAMHIMTLISTRHSAHDLIVKLSPSLYVVVVASLTGKTWLREVLLTMEQQTVTNPAVINDLCAMTKHEITFT